MDKIEYNLSVPIQVGDKKITKFEIDYPKAKHLRSMPIKTDLWTGEHIINFVSDLSNNPPSTVGMIEMFDLMAMMELVTPFLTNSRKTGN